jgi:hypothetical protein
MIKLTSATNFYKDVRWKSVNNYKCSFHSHNRTCGTGNVTEEHESHGFDVYALTEKNEYNKPSSSVMLTIGAFESTTETEHFVALFVDSNTGTSFSAVNGKEGSVMWHAHPKDIGRPKFSTAQFASLLQQYPRNIGLEVLSRNYEPQVNEDPNDPYHPDRRGKGQYVRTSLIVDELFENHNLKNIQLVGVTDGYCDRELEFGDTWANSSWCRVLAPSLSEETVRDALLEGHHFFVSNMHDQESDMPFIKRIRQTGDSLFVEVEGSYDKVEWVKKDNEVLHTGEKMPLEKLKGKGYVRCCVWQGEDFDDFYNATLVGSQIFYEEDVERPEVGMFIGGA